MIIRGMALDEIEPADFLRVWWKEIRVALLCGGTLSIVNFVRIYLQYNVFAAEPNPDCVRIAAVVSLTLIATVCIAKSLGCILPMLAKKLKLDPALMAAPMITTVTDACSILVFFTLALTILRDRLYTTDGLRWEGKENDSYRKKLSVGTAQLADVAAVLCAVLCLRLCPAARPCRSAMR